MKPKKLTEWEVDKILEYLKKKKTSEFIQGKLNVTRQQVAAVKAHKTMGTYL